MSGNDIVDIQTAAKENNWKRCGYLEKIFIPAEQRYILGSPDPGQMVWRLWSMKESACKVHMRQRGERRFTPLKFQCTVYNDDSGSVVTADGHYQYNTSTIHTEEYIYSIACPCNKRSYPLTNRCFAIPANKVYEQQQFIYAMIITEYARLTGKKREQLSLIKNTLNIPSLFCREENLLIPVSITHHGRFAAFTIN